MPSTPASKAFLAPLTLKIPFKITGISAIFLIFFMNDRRRLINAYLFSISFGIFLLILALKPTGLFGIGTE